MQDKPLIFFDPYPRNEEMVFTNDVKTELEKISNLIYHFGSQWNYVLSLTMVTLLPIAIIFAYLQKFITTGIASTGMK